MATRFQRHVHRRAAEISVMSTGDLQRLRLGMFFAKTGMVAFADHLIRLNDDTPDKRIGLDTATPALGQGERSLHMLRVDFDR